MGKGARRPDCKNFLGSYTLQNFFARTSRFAVLVLSVAASVLVLTSPAALGARAYTYVTAPDNSGSPSRSGSRAHTNRPAAS